jgi:hypothetical protein
MLDLWEPLPQKLALDLPEQWGGPGVSLYELCEGDDGPSYLFVCWEYERVTDPLQDEAF